MMIRTRTGVGHSPESWAPLEGEAGPRTADEGPDALQEGPEGPREPCGPPRGGTEGGVRVHSAPGEPKGITAQWGASEPPQNNLKISKASIFYTSSSLASAWTLHLTLRK